MSLGCLEARKPANLPRLAQALHISMKVKPMNSVTEEEVLHMVKATGPIEKATADFELEKRIRNFLSTRHQPALERLEVEASGGTVTLRGKVTSYYEKQLGQTCCRRVAGVVRLIDAVVVD